jgi:hypothetical protein
MQLQMQAAVNLSIPEHTYRQNLADRSCGTRDVRTFRAVMAQAAHNQSIAQTWCEAVTSTEASKFSTAFDAGAARNSLTVLLMIHKTSCVW